MPIHSHGNRVSLDAEDVQERLKQVVARRLELHPRSILEVEVLKRSLDARRKKQEPAWVFAVHVWTEDEREDWVAHRREVDARRKGETPTFQVPQAVPPKNRPIIVGFGPAGLFAALAFADSGIPCTVLERGFPLAERHHHVRDFRRKGTLHTESNLCFGEGGAGTYSDGKLYTRKKHPLVRAVYERLVAFGADPAILTDAHPHIGTNRLYAILQAMREHLMERGVEIRFQTQMKELLVHEGSAAGVRLTNGEEIVGGPVILATGHSARELYESLHSQGVTMTPKAFAIGARCEHPQELIDTVQLGEIRQKNGVEPAEYFLSCQLGSKGLYSFCMCPGGFIIPTPTETGHLNVNGMSNSNRGGRFANAALVVTVEPEDFFIETPGDLEAHGVLAGLAYQRHWERAAFEAGGGGYHAPAQRATDLVAGRGSSSLPERTSYRPGLVAGDLRDVLPRPIVRTLRDGFPKLDQKLPGYLMEEAILVGVETTTSTPVRMARDEGRESPGMPGLYPTGEGAGFSGGVVSSAIEGIASATAAMAKFHGGELPSWMSRSRNGSGRGAS